MNYQNTSERINETGHNKYRERCKTKENDVFKIKRKKYINDKNSELCDTLEHEELKARKRKQHQTFLDNIRGSPKHQRRKEKIRIKKKNGLKNRVQAFKTQIQEGPFYVCIVGNRGIDRSSVCCFRFENCEILNERIIFCVHSHDGESYICVTCDQKKLRKMIFQAKHLPINLVLKNFQFSFRLFVGLRVLVSRRILFKKISIMLKDQSPKLKGSICNIPISEIDANCMTLPRRADSNGLIVAKLKQENMGFEAIYNLSQSDQKTCRKFLNFLKQCIHLYSILKLMLIKYPIIKRII